MKQTPDPAAGASRWEAPAAGSSRPAKPASDLAAAVDNCSDGGPRQLDSAALRDALLDLHEFWLTTKAAEIGDHRRPAVSRSSPPAGWAAASWCRTRIST